MVVSRDGLKHKTPRKARRGDTTSGKIVFTSSSRHSTSSSHSTDAVSGARSRTTASFSGNHGLQGSQTYVVRAHNRVGSDDAGNVNLLNKVPSMGRQKAVIKARREAKRVLRRDSRSHKQREEESVTSLVQMSGVEAIGMARDSRDTSPIAARSEAQAQYLEAIESKQLIFATGEAGDRKSVV